MRDVTTKGLADQLASVRKAQDAARAANAQAASDASAPRMPQDAGQKAGEQK